MSTETGVRKASQKALATVAAVLIAAVGALGGSRATPSKSGQAPAQAPELHGERLRAVEVRVDALDGRLERIEGKIDRLLERK